MNTLCRYLFFYLFIFGFVQTTNALHKIVFTPQWTPQSQFAGYYVAQKLGYYKEAGLDVEFQYEKTSNANVENLKKGRANVITLMLSQALQNYDDGVPLVNLLQTYQRSSLVIISHPDKPLNQIKQFRNIRIGYFNAGFNEIAQAFNQIEQLQWTPVFFEKSSNLLYFKAVDAIVGMEYNELQQIIYSGIKVTDKNLFRFSDHKYNIPADGLYTTRAYYEQYKKELDAFVAASKKGWMWAYKNPEKTLEIILNIQKKKNIYSSRTLQKKQLEIVLDAMKQTKGSSVSFDLDRNTFNESVNILKSGRIIKKPIHYNLFIAR